VFKQRHDQAVPIAIEFDGERYQVPAGISVAAALLTVTGGATRSTPVSGAGRAPYCMMGVCFECLVEIDSIPNRQACMIQVRDGMRIRRQLGAAALGAEHE